MNDVQTLLRQTVRRFLEDLEGNGKSVLTIQKYDASLRLFEQLSGVTDPLEITKAAARTYKSHLAQYKTQYGHLLSIRTRNGHISALRRFLRYCVCEEELDVLPPDRISRIKEPQRKPKWLTLDDLERFLATPDISTKNGKRDSAMLELFFSTGLRLSELVSLNRSDIYLSSREISIRGKGDVVRVVFVSDRAAHAIEQYLNCRIDHLTPLFIARHQKATSALPPGNEFRISGRWIQKLVKKYALSAGIVINPTPHTLRHTFATDLLGNGADLRSIQELLGHKDIRTTQVYTHLTSPDLKRAHGQFHSNPN